MYGWSTLADADRVRQNADTRLLVSVTITRPDRQSALLLNRCVPSHRFFNSTVLDTYDRFQRSP